MAIFQLFIGWNKVIIEITRVIHPARSCMLRFGASSFTTQASAGKLSECLVGFDVFFQHLFSSIRVGVVDLQRRAINSQTTITLASQNAVFKILKSRPETEGLPAGQCGQKQLHPEPPGSRLTQLSSAINNQFLAPSEMKRSGALAYHNLPDSNDLQSF